MLFISSCSSPLAIVKKDVPAKPPPKEKPAVIEKDYAAPAEEDGAFHIVGHNETLRQICEVYGLDFAKVVRINGIPSPYLVKAGDTVFLPPQALLSETELAQRGSGSSKLCAQTTDSRSQLAAAIRGKRDSTVPQLGFPVANGTLTSPFGYRWGKFHTGLDIASPVGKPVIACADGKVIFTGSRKRFRRYGNTVLIDHGKGVYTYYAHLNQILVKKNQKVRPGQKIATVGTSGRSTGPHLHLEVRVGHKLYNPLAYFVPTALSGTRLAKRFTDSPMGPVRARWAIPDLLTARR